MLRRLGIQLGSYTFYENKMENITFKNLLWQKKAVKILYVYTMSSRENIAGLGTYNTKAI